jgi:hypothetical protein
MENECHRPQIQTLACPYTDCHLYAMKGANNLTLRKLYGKDRIRYLRCSTCSREFSERKNTALFNTKIEEKKAISVAEHLAEGISTKGTSRLVGVSAEAVRRLKEGTLGITQGSSTKIGSRTSKLHRCRWMSATVTSGARVNPSGKLRP